MKLFLIVRADLSPGQQAVQAAHALRQFVADHPRVDREWFEVSNTLALLSVPTETDLHALLKRARDRHIEVAPFREPDRDNELTAIALGPRGKKLTQSLPLALAV